MWGTEGAPASGGPPCLGCPGRVRLRRRSSPSGPHVTLSLARRGGGACVDGAHVSRRPAGAEMSRFLRSQGATASRPMPESGRHQGKCGWGCLLSSPTPRSCDHSGRGFQGIPVGNGCKERGVITLSMNIGGGRQNRKSDFKAA